MKIEEARNYSVSSVARAVGLSHQYVSRFFAGLLPPQREEWVRVMIEELTEEQVKACVRIAGKKPTRKNEI